MTQEEDTKDFRPHIGEVYLMEFKGKGSVQHGWRPGIVFQNDIGNAFSPNIIALPLTSSLKKRNQPTHVVIEAGKSGLFKDSMVLCENPECISKDCVGEYITTIPNHYMKEIAAASLLATAAIAFLDEEALLSVWRQAGSMRN